MDRALCIKEEFYLRTGAKSAVAFFFVIRGPLSLECTTKVLDALAQRHPVLRSKPDLRSRRWLPLGVNEKYYKLSGLSIDVDSQGLEQAAADFVASELRIPPSIEPPAFRILQMFPSDFASSQLSAICFVYSHAYFDGMSRITIANDFLHYSQLYLDSRLESTPISSLPALPDVLELMGEKIITIDEPPPVGTQLRDPPPSMLLPFDEPSPGEITQRCLLWKVPMERVKAVQAGCRSRNQSFNAVLCAAFALAVYKKVSKLVSPYCEQRKVGGSGSKCIHIHIPVNVRQRLHPPVSLENVGLFIQWCSASGVVIHEGDDKWKVAERITELLNDDIANRRVIRTILPYILSSPPAPARSVPFVISNLGVIASCDTVSLSLISMNASHGLSNSAPCIFVSLHTVKDILNVCVGFQYPVYSEHTIRDFVDLALGIFLIA